MVWTDAPCACTASIRQERTISPFTRTVQAPQTPCSQPTWVPVSCRCSRRKSARLSRGKTCASTRSPLTSSEIGIGAVTQSPALRSGRPSRRHATHHQHLRQMPAHRAGRLLILLGIEFFVSAADASDNSAGVTAALTSLLAALASTGRSPTAKNAMRRSAEDTILPRSPAPRGRRWRNRRAAGRIHGRNARNCFRATGSSTATSNSCADSAVS